MEPNSIALTEMVKKLGYKDHTNLANKIANVLKDKEDFEKKYIITNRDNNIHRVEKIEVLCESENLVDNIAILMQYPHLFGRDADTYAPYRELLKGVDEKSFKLKVQRMSDKLKTDIKRSQNSLKMIPRFMSAVLSEKSINIRTQSLRELLEKTNGDNELIDLQNTFELASWNVILELKDKIKHSNEDSTLYQKLGEKLFEIGEYEESLQALDKSTDLNPENGISWAIKSIIAHKQLTLIKKEHVQALARTDFSGEIANPITAEEHWINERVEDTYGDLAAISKEFLSSAINALTFWPAWDIKRSYGKAEGKPNFFYKLNMSHDTDVELERQFLFLAMINEIDAHTFEVNRDKLVEIIRSFQSWNTSLYPCTSVFHNLNNNDKANVFKVLRLVSSDDIKAALIDYFHEKHYYPLRARRDLELLKLNNVSELYCQFIGKKEYSRQLSLLLNLDIKNQEIDNFNKLATLHFFEVNASLAKVKRKFKADLESEFRPPTFFGEEINMSSGEVKTSLTNALNISVGWDDYLESPAWQKYPYTFELDRYFFSLLLTSNLLELIHLNNIDRNIGCLHELCENESSLRSALSEMPTYFYCALIDRIDTDKLKKVQRDSLMLALDIIYEFRQVLDDEEVEASFYYD